MSLSPEKRQQIIDELKRRGSQHPSEGEPNKSTPSAEEITMSLSPEKRQQIIDELKRRHKRTPSFMGELGKLGRNFLGGATELGRSVGYHHMDPFNDPVSPHELERINKVGAPQLDKWLSPAPETEFGKWAGSAARTAGSFLDPSLGSLGMMGKGAKALGKLAGLGASAGVLSHGLKNTGVPPIVADISGSIAATPLALGAAKAARGIAFPFSKTVRTYGRTKGAERGLKTILGHELEGHSGQDINLTGHMAQLSPEVSSEVAGTGVRNTIQKRVGDLEKVQSSTTGPKFAEIERETGFFPVENAERFMGEQVEKGFGESKNTFHKFSREISDKSPDALESILDQLNLSSEIPFHLKPSQAQNLLKEVNDKIATAAMAGKNALVFRLYQFKDALKNDVAQHYPKLLKVREEYAKLAGPISAIKEHPILGDFIRKTGKSTYELNPSKIPELIHSKILKSPEDALQARNLLKNSKSYRQACDYIEHQVAKEITNWEGKVSAQALDNWKKAHPAAFAFDPGLEKKLSNITNARFFARNVERKFNLIPIEDKGLREVTKLAMEQIPGMKMLSNFAGKFSSKGALYDKERIRERLMQRVQSDPTYVDKLLREHRTPWYQKTPARLAARSSLGALPRKSEEQR